VAMGSSTDSGPSVGPSTSGAGGNAGADAAKWYDLFSRNTRD